MSQRGIFVVYNAIHWTGIKDLMFDIMMNFKIFDNHSTICLGRNNIHEVFIVHLKQDKPF